MKIHMANDLENDDYIYIKTSLVLVNDLTFNFITFFHSLD